MSARWRPQQLSPLQNPQKQWITNYKLTKIALGKALDFNEEASSNTARLKTKNGHIKKHRKYFTSITLPPRPDQLDGKRDPFGGISFYKEKKSRSNSESLTTRTLAAFATKDPIDFTSTDSSWWSCLGSGFYISSPGREWSLWWSCFPGLQLPQCPCFLGFGCHSASPFKEPKLPLLCTPPPNPKS